MARLGIFDHVHLESYKERRTDPFERPSFSVTETVSETGEVRAAEFSYQHQYGLRLCIETTFWANKAQFDSHMAAARNLLCAEIYGDVRANLDRLTHAVFNGDREDALTVISRLRAAIKS